MAAEQQQARALARQAVQEREEKVPEDVMDWVEVKRESRRRTAQGRCDEEDRKSVSKVQIFVKMDGSRTVAMDVAQNDKVSDMMKRLPCGEDVYVTSEGRVLRGGEELKSYGVRDGSTVEVARRLRGGGKHKDKNNKMEKKQAASPKRSVPPQGQFEQKDAGESESDKKLATQECDRDAMIRMMQENEDSRRMIACVSEGSDMEVEQIPEDVGTG